MKGYTKVPNELIQSPWLAMNEKCMLMYLMSRSGRKKQCFPSLKTIAEDLGASESTVISIIKKLESKNLIVREKRISDNGGYMSNIYTVNAQC